MGDNKKDAKPAGKPADNKGAAPAKPADGGKKDAGKGGKK